MGILEGRTILVTGIITPQSIAFRAAERMVEEGASVIVTGYGRLSLVERVAGRIPGNPPVIELDVTDPEHLGRLEGEVRRFADRLDGVLHSIAYAPPSCLGGFVDAPWEDVARTFQVSAYSYLALARAVLPLMKDGGGALVGLTFDGTKAWNAYDWMGVAKSALESTSRYVAKELGPHGVRSNLVAAGPLRTTAAKAIPGLLELEESWDATAPLGWSLSDVDAAARACTALLSDWFPATSGEVVHVDGGYHAIG